ncbi:MAG: nucleotidyltransferase domain-containing protein [bacterium]
MLEFNSLKHIFKDYPYIASAYLFGSQATGRIMPMSDVDIAILVMDNAPKGRELLHEEDYLSYRIAEGLKVREVDLIDLNSQGLIFQHNVLRTGKLIYDAYPLFRIQFEMRVIPQFCDFEPTLRFIERFHFQGRLRRLARV